MILDAPTTRVLGYVVLIVGSWKLVDHAYRWQTWVEVPAKVRIRWPSLLVIASEAAIRVSMIARRNVLP